MTYEKVDEYVWCDHEGCVHEDDPDPYTYGPQYGIVLGHDVDPPSDLTYWTKRDDGLWEYHCPGPHSPLFREIGTE